MCICCSIIFSCTKEAVQAQPENLLDLTAEEISALETYVNGTVVSEDEVVATANSIMAFLDASSLTKGPNRTISSITPISGTNTRTGEDTTTAYVVNFGENQGYAILSADRRTDDIFVVSDNGNFDLSQLESDYNAGKVPSGALLLLSNIEQVAAAQIAASEAEQEQLVQSALEKINAEDSTKTRRLDPFSDELPHVEVERDIMPGSTSMPRTVTTETDWTNVSSGSIPPMVTVTWAQNSDPYDRYTPAIDGQHALAGCVPVAIGQLLSYWRYPTEMNWDAILQYPGIRVTFDTTPDSVKDEVAHLLASIGTAVGAIYGLDMTGASPESIVPYMESIGCAFPGTFGSYDANLTLSSIYNGMPVIVTGFSYQTTHYVRILGITFAGKPTLSDGHAWVIDGAMRQSKTTTVTDYKGNVVNTTTKYRTLFHCNFGWRGNGDGYYATDTFNEAAGPVTRAQWSVTEGSEHYFQYDLNAVYNIQPL